MKDVYLGQGNIGNDGRATRLWTGQSNSDLPEGNPDICIASPLFHLKFMTRGGNDGRVLRSGQHWIAWGQPWHLHRASSPVKPFFAGMGWLTHLGVIRFCQPFCFSIIQSTSASASVLFSLILVLTSIRFTCALVVSKILDFPWQKLWKMSPNNPWTKSQRCVNESPNTPSWSSRALRSCTCSLSKIGEGCSYKYVAPFWVGNQCQEPGVEHKMHAFRSSCPLHSGRSLLVVLKLIWQRLAAAANLALAPTWASSFVQLIHFKLPFE